MKKIFVILMLLTTLLTTGCFIKEKDLGQMFFPISLGMSYEDNKYKVYLQVLNTSALSIVETEGSQNESTYILIHAENENISTAFTELGLKSLTYISAIKLKSIVFHKSIFEGPIEFEQICQYFINSPIFRTHVQVFITDTKMEEFYSVKYMLVGSSVYSHSNEDEEQIIRGYVKQTFLLDNLKSLNDLNRMYYFPRMDVKEGNIEEGDKDGKLSTIKTYFYNGICFSTYSEEKIKCISKEEALGFRWYNEIEYINEDVGTNDVPINLIIDKVKWESEVSDTFKISIKTDAYVNFNLSSLSIDEIKQKLDEKIKKDVYNTLKIAYESNIDIYHLNDKALRKNKELKYNLNNVEIIVDSSIKNTTYYKY